MLKLVVNIVTTGSIEKSDRKDLLVYLGVNVCKSSVNRMCWSELDLSGSGSDILAKSCQYGNELLSTKFSIEYLSYYRLLKKHSSPMKLMIYSTYVFLKRY